MQSAFRVGAISYETVPHERELPFRCFFNSVRFVGSHWHAETELLLQVEGELALSMPDGITVLGPGDLFLANPFQVHSLVARTPENLTLALQIDLTDPVLLPRLLGHRRFVSARDWSAELAGTVRAQLTRVARELALRDDGYAHACLSALADLIATLIRHAAGQETGPAGTEERPAWFDHVSTIIRFLQEHYDHPISLDDVAQHVELSRYHVSHLVKAATGLSVQENLALIRTNRAVHLMFTTEARLVDIALDAGFSHLKYFNKYFRRLYGETPSAVRERVDWREAVNAESTGTVRLPSPELVRRLG